jgi:Flp pilus assembly protein TadD
LLSVNPPKVLNYMRRLSYLRLFALTVWCVALSQSANVAHAQTSRSNVSAAEVRQSIATIRSTDLNDAVLSNSLSMGRGLLRDGRYAEASELFAALAEKRPFDFAVLYGQALATFNSGRAADAEPLARKALDVAAAAAREGKADKSYAQQRADALTLLAVIVSVRGDDPSALKFLQQAVKLAPDNFDAQLSLGRLLFGMGDNSAIKAFRAARSLQPSNSQALFFLATAVERSGDIEGALSSYRELTALRPDIYEGHLGLGALLVKRGGSGIEEGLNELNRALQINPNVYEAQVAAGRALIASGRPSDALAHLQRAAELAPANPEPHYQLSLAYRRLGRNNEAAEQTAIVKRINESRRTKTRATSDAP